MTIFRNTRLFAAVVLAGVFTAGCDVHGVSDPGTLSAIVVSPNPQTLGVNATQQFTAVGTDFSGARVSITPVWTVANGGGTITASGMFTASTVIGTFANTVVASSGGKSASATVVVTPGPLATIVVSPSPDTLAIGAAQQFVAVGKDASGNLVAIVPTWSVVSAGGAITSVGMFTAGTVSGTFANTVQASSGGIKGAATVVVTPGAAVSLAVTPNPITLAVGAVQQFTATGKDANGNSVVVVPAWSVDSAGGTINTAGLFTAGATIGTFSNTVRATSGALTARATVTVVAGALATITVTPNPASVLVGTTQQFAAVGRDAGGNAVAVTPTWSVINGGGTINASSGVFTAGGAVGTYTNTVQATSGGISGTATVFVSTPVVPPVAATITVTPNPATVLANGQQQFAATAVDANGNPVSITPVWSVVNGGGTINASTGVFTAGAAAGTFTGTVKATSGSVSGVATVIVTLPPPVAATITVAPNPAILLANAQQQFAAVALDANGNAVSITPVWSVINGGGTINASTGVFTAGNTAGTFTGTVKATNGTVSGVATVTVTTTPPVLTTITVTPNPANMNTGDTQQFTAVGRDANGNVMAVTPVWSVAVTVPSAGTINAATGLFTAGATAGTYTNAVVATSGLISGKATVIEGSVFVPVVNLGTAALNGIMAGTAVSCAGPATVNANVSISPGNTISGPCVVTGVQHLGDPTAAQNQLDLTAAYNTLAGLACPPANFITTDLGGTTKLPGVYCNATTMGLTGVLTLDGNGDPNATFVFQVGSGLTTAGDVVLINGAQAKNVFWQVGSSATLGTASHFQGNILALTSITLVTNATMTGRALARNGAVTMGTGTVITLP